jgi:glucokinase
MILAGDVGGTKVHLALYDFINGKLEYSRDARYPAKEYSGLEEIVREFLGSVQVTAACFGVPGPVRDGRLRLTNLPWTLDSRELSVSLGINHVFLINDLEANGYGVAELTSDQIYVLSEGDSSQIGNRALLAAGTGLGEGLLIWNGHSHIPYPCEGGHTDYAPRNEDEIDLLRFLKQKYNGRISFERVLSGMGLTNIYEFLREVRGMAEPVWLAERMAAEDPNAVITELALAAKSEICEKTLDMFVSAYGAEAGNLRSPHPGKAQGRHLHEGLHRQGTAQPVAHQYAGAHHSGEPRRAAGRRRLRRGPRRRTERHIPSRRLRQNLEHFH